MCDSSRAVTSSALANLHTCFLGRCGEESKGRPAPLAFPEHNLVQAAEKTAGALHLGVFADASPGHCALGWVTEMELWFISSAPG